MKKVKSLPVIFSLGFYIVCCVFRSVEYFLLRTDQSIIGENVIHKLVGIMILAVTLGLIGYKWCDIGFCSDLFIRDTLKGLSLGIGVFILAYGVEMIIQMMNNNIPKLSVYVTSYAIVGNRSLQGGLGILIFCIVGNIINVIMEEGVFRGLFHKLIQEKHSFWFACIFSSVLFGVWHIPQPIRNVLDGEQSPMGAVMSGILLVVTSTLLGIQYCMLNRVTGSIWTGVSAHFANNTAINLFHISTINGVDELQTMRISIAQSVSFVVVLIIYLIHQRKNITNRIV
jgi:Predicted metal-dependent membrane protease